MNCDRADILLARAGDPGGIPAAERPALRGHLAECAACRTLAATLGYERFLADPGNAHDARPYLDLLVPARRPILAGREWVAAAALLVATAWAGSAWFLGRGPGTLVGPDGRELSLVAGQAVEGGDAPLRLSLRGGVDVLVRPGARVVVLGARGDARQAVELQRGLAEVEVDPAVRGGVEILCGVGDVRVLGTRFAAARFGFPSPAGGGTVEVLLVAVRRGHVRVRDARGREADARAGETLLVVGDGPPLGVSEDLLEGAPLPTADVRLALEGVLRDCGAGRTTRGAGARGGEARCAMLMARGARLLPALDAILASDAPEPLLSLVRRTRASLSWAR